MAPSGTAQPGLGTKRRARPLAALGLAVAAVAGCGETIQPRAPAPPVVTATTTTTMAPTTTTTAPVQYVVVRGDSLSSIAAQFGITITDLAAANGLADPNDIKVGQVLTIPPPTTTTLAFSSTTR